MLIQIFAIEIYFRSYKFFLTTWGDKFIFT